jgi:hypothetical protein
MGINFGALGKALLVTVSPLTWVGARAVEKVTGNDNLVRNNPLTYYTDVFTRSKPADAAPAGGTTKPAEGPAGYQATPLDFEQAMKAIEGLEKAPKFN